MSKKIIKWENDTGEVIKRTYDYLVEGITGIAASDRKELALSVGHIFQLLRKGQFLSRLGEEWGAYREKGRIKDDYMGSEQHRDCLGELLKAMDRDELDEVRFNLLKKIFLVAATETKSDRESVLPHQYMVLARSLKSGEVLVLEAAYRIAKAHRFDRDVMFYERPLVNIANESGLDHKELVGHYESGLIEKNLFTSWTSDREVPIGEHFRLTELGWGLCEFIDGYDDGQSSGGETKGEM